MVTLLLLLAAATAEAAPRDPLPPDTGFRVVGVGRKDAFWRMRDDVIGMVCVVEDPGLAPAGRRWWAGAARCSDGLPYFFFQVAVEPVSPEVVAAAFEDRPRRPLSLSGTAPIPPSELLDGDAVASNDDATAATAAAPATFAEPLPADAWLPGTRVRVTGIAPRDVHAGRRDLVGVTCEVAEDPLVPAEDRWRTGAVRCGEEELFFYQAAFEAVPEGTPLGPAPTPVRSRR